MNLIYFAAYIAACGAAKLDRTYLPPASAALAGGSPGSLQAPLTRTADQSSQIVPPGGFVNDREGVVVNAAIADTRASSQQSGLGGTRNSYGSTDSKVGDAAFRTTSPKFPQAQHNIVPNNFAFGAADDASLNPDLSAFYQPSPAFRPGNVQIVRDYASNIVKYQNDIDLDKFNYTYETDNGIKASESGVSINGVQAEGGFSYTGDDGHVYSVSYTADEGGFRPHGSHLPTPPPIPVEILKSLEQNAKDEAAGLHDDGSYDAQKYNEEYDYTKFNHDDYNDWLLNKIGEELFGSANLASKNKTVKPDSSEVTGASGFDATNNKDTLLNEQNGQLSNNGFGSRNEYSSPNKGQSENVFSAGGNKDSHNVLPAQSLSQQQLQAQSAFTKPSSSETSQSSFTSQISSLPSHNFNTQEAISSFVVGNDNNPSLSSQSYNKPSQDNPFTDIFLNKNQPINQESTLSSNKQTPQNSFSQSFASVSSPSFQSSLTSQQFLSTNSPLQSTQNLNSRLPTTHFSSVSSESFNPSQNNIAQTQYTKKPISSFATSFSSVMPTKQPQITLTTPLESTKINEFSNSFDSGKTELLGVTSAPDSTHTNDQSSQFSFQNVQFKEKYPTQSAPTLSGNTFSDFSIFSFNSNPQTTSQNFDNTQTIQYQNKEKMSTESPSTLNGNKFSGFSTSSFNSNPQNTSQNFDKSQTTQPQNKEKLPTDSTSALSGNTFSGFNKPSFNTSPQTTSQTFPNTQTTQIQNNKPQVTQVVFSSNRPGDSVFGSNTQRPTYNTQSNQFIGQQGADHSYIYNRPLIPFQTPFDSNNRVILPSGSLSSRFDKVTQSVSTPLDSTFSTQYQSQTNSNNSPDPTTLTPFSSSFTTLKENDRNKNTFEISNGITQASISPFPSILPTISSNFKPPSTHFNLKPFQQAVYNTPGQSQFSQTSTTSAIAPTQFVSTISDNQKYNTQSQSDQRPSEMQEKPNNGEIYEYSKPTQSKTEKEVVDLNQKTERPQFTISSTHFNQDGSTTTSVAQNTAQIEQQKPLSLFEEQSSLPVNQQSFINAIHNVNSGLTTQFTQSSTNDNTMSQFKQPSTKPGLEASNYKPPKFFPSTVSSDTFITQKQDTQVDTTTTISQNPTFGVQSNTGFSGSDIKDATTFNYRQSNQKIETQLNYKPSTSIPGAFQTIPEISQSQSFSPQLTTIQPQFGIQSGIQFNQGIFSNKATTVPQIQQSVTKFDFKPSTSISSMQQSPSNRFNPQNTDKQLDSTSFVQSINEPSKFGIQSNTQESQGSFDSERTTTSQSPKPSQQTSTTFYEPSTSNPTQTETSSGITQFGEVYDYTKPTQGLLIPSPNKNNSQVSHLKPEIGVQTNTRFGQQTQPPHFNLQPTTQFNQKENEKDKSQSHSTQAEPVTGIEYYTGSTLDPSTSEDQKTFNTKVPDEASTTGEIYNYKNPTQSTLTSQNNDNVQPNQAKPQFEAVINTDFGPQIIPIFQRERPTQFGQQTQQSHFNLQSNTQLNSNENEKDGTMSHFTQNEPTTGTLYNTGSTLLPTTPQDQMIFNTKVPDQTSTTGEIYDYRKPTQGLLTSQNKNNVQSSQIKPQFGTRINTDFSPQIIPIFQREQPTQFGQKTQQSHFNIQSNQNVNEKDETIPYFTQSEPVTSQDYNTGTTPQDQTIFNTRGSDQASTTGEIYEYTKPEKGLPSQSQKENSLFGQKIQGQQSGSQTTKKDGNKSNLPTTVQSTQSPITTIGVAQSESIGNSQNANTLAPQSVYTQGSGSETKPFDSRPQLAFHSACCKGFKAENNRGNAPVNQVLVNKFNPNFGADAFEQNKNIGQVDQNKNRGEAQASDLPSFQDFEPPKGSQTYAGIGEKFGGPRKPPSFDETGYHY